MTSGRPRDDAVRRREIFADALAIPEAAARAAFLAEACAGDAALLAEIVDLIAWHDRDPGFLPAASASKGHPAADPDADLPPPHVPGFTLGAVIGEGGAGRVYGGWQEAPRRRVAVKVLRSALGGHAATQRFLREAEILARLDHPGIARVIAVQTVRWGGATVPAIAMEMVEGALPVTRWAAAGPATRPALVAVFRAACEAVGHAHRLGVVHRDLKPGNILVDRTGRPKVIDFDWARWQETPPGMPPGGTASGLIVGTHAYMSPEHFRGGASVDARSDVWSLGVVLFELLAGRPPFDVSGITVYDAAALIRDTPAPAVTRFAPSIPRDLVVIVATCLDPRPDRRYADAAALAADLGRHLAGEAILACPAGFVDGVRQLARRHRTAALATAAVAAAIMAGSTGVAIFARRADVARAAALRARDAESAALAEARTARDRAAEAARDATWGEYVANVNRLSALPGTAQPALVQRLRVDTSRGAAELGLARPGGPLPLEGALLEPALDASIGRLVADAAVGSLAWAPGGATVAAGCRDGGLLFWDTLARSAPRRIKASAGPINALAFSADGRRLATASSDRMVRVWDFASAALVAEFGPHREPVTGVALDDRGGAVASVSSDGYLRVWDLDARRPVGSLWNGRGKLTAVRFHPGDAALVACGNLEGTSTLWNARSGVRIGRYGGRRTRHAAVAFSADGRFLAVPAFGSGVTIADGTSGEVLRELAGPDAAVTLLAFSADGTRLAVVCGDAPVGVWDPATGNRVAVVHGHKSRVTAAAFSPDGRSLATASADRMVRLHASADGRLIDALRGHDHPVSHLAWSPSGDRLVTSGDATLRLWDASGPGGPAVMRGDGGRLRSLRFTADGAALVAATSTGRIDVWDVATASRRRSCTADASSAAPVAIPSTVGTGTVVAFGTTDGTIALDTLDDRPATLLPPARASIRALEFDRTGDRLLVADAKGGMRLHARAGGSMIASATLPTGGLRRAAIAPNGAAVAAAGDTGHVVVWHPDSDRLATLPGHQDEIRALAFHPGDPARFVTVGMSGRLVLRDAASGSTLCELDLGFDPTAELSFSPAGDRLALMGRSGRLCLVSLDGDAAPRFAVGHDLRINAVAWSPDGSRLVTGADDHTVRVWDAITGTSLVVLEGHDGPVTDVATSPDGRIVASASADGTVRLWGRSNAAIDAARRDSTR